MFPIALSPGLYLSITAHLWASTVLGVTPVFVHLTENTVIGTFVRASGIKTLLGFKSAGIVMFTVPAALSLLLTLAASISIFAKYPKTVLVVKLGWPSEVLYVSVSTTMVCASNSKL